MVEKTAQILPHSLVVPKGRQTSSNAMEVLGTWCSAAGFSYWQDDKNTTLTRGRPASCQCNLQEGRWGDQHRKQDQDSIRVKTRSRIKSRVETLRQANSLEEPAGADREPLEVGALGGLGSAGVVVRVGQSHHGGGGRRLCSCGRGGDAGRAGSSARSSKSTVRRAGHPLPC